MFVGYVYANNYAGSRLGQTGRTELKSTKHNIPKYGNSESPLLNQSITTSSIRGQILRIGRESEGSSPAIEAQQQQ